MPQTCLGNNNRISTYEKVLTKIRPGMRIFLSTGVAEPRTLLKRLMAAQKGNLADLELIQLISLGEAVSIDQAHLRKYRLKTFFAGWVASEAITAGRVDLIPCRFSQVPRLIADGAIPVDAAFVQISPPDEDGYASLGVAVDVARNAMEKASLVVGEINEGTPRTLGDTMVHVDDFDYLVRAEEPMIYLPRWPVDDTFDRLSRNVAGLVQDGDCLGFLAGPLYEGLGRHLSSKRNLGIHGLFLTDALMDLIRSGAVTNRRKGLFRGKCLAAYAFGSRKLMKWLSGNPLVEFQSIDIVGDPMAIGKNDNYITILPVRKVDLAGNVAMHTGKGNVAASVGAAQELMAGAGFSKGGRTVVALPSKNLKGGSNILLGIGDYPNELAVSESLDFVVTEYGVAHLSGKTLRERAMALIDIAHPDHRANLVQSGKKNKILYVDQIYLTESGHMYPYDLQETRVVKGGLNVRFRAIKPSDEDAMRRLFYRFSSEAVYYRYFSPIKSMPHERTQEYVNVDYKKTMSIVGLVGEPGAGKIIAEARYVLLPDHQYADSAYVVDEAFQGRGIGTALLNILIHVARERGLKGIVADVLPSNRAMWKIFEKAPYPLKVEREPNSYHLTLELEGVKS